jgi:hypothetical protein
MVNSWGFDLKINPECVHVTDRTKEKMNQVSQLRFRTPDEALAFGKRMFEPPLSVVEWTIAGSNDAPNFPFDKAIYPGMK